MLWTEHHASRVLCVGIFSSPSQKTFGKFPGENSLAFSFDTNYSIQPNRTFVHPHNIFSLCLQSFCSVPFFIQSPLWCMSLWMRCRCTCSCTKVLLHHVFSAESSSFDYLYFIDTGLFTNGLFFLLRTSGPQHVFIYPLTCSRTLWIVLRIFGTTVPTGTNFLLSWHRSRSTIYMMSICITL